MQLSIRGRSCKYFDYEYLKMDINNIFLSIFIFNSQKAGSFGRVSFEPNTNSFGREIHKYIENNLTMNIYQNQDVSTKADSRGARRVTYEVMNGKLKYAPKPERTRELAKNLWKMQKLNQCILDKTIKHLLATFPELSNLIKENEDCTKTVLNQRNQTASPNDDGVQKKIAKDMKDKDVESDQWQTESISCKEKPIRNKRKKLEGLLPSAKRKIKKSLKTRKSSFSSTSSTSSKPSSHSKPKRAEKDYEYVNNVEPYDLNFEDDQESIDQLEADLMDESLIELTNIL